MVTQRTICFVVAALLGALGGTANADPIAVFGSGIDAQGNVLAPGSLDPHYTLEAVPQGEAFGVPGQAIVQVPHPVYVPNDPVGAAGTSWIGSQQNAAGSIAGGLFVFRTTFDLTGFDAATARIDGNVAVDNTLEDVLLNGVSLGVSGGQFIAFSAPFSATTGFVDGVNTLEFVVRNLAPGPSGFRVVLSGDATLVPTSTEVAARMDVRPGRDRINLRSRLPLPTVVYGSEDLAAADIDVASLRLAGASVLTTRRGWRLASVFDVDGDGYDDLLFLVSARALDLEEGATEITLAGTLDDGSDLVATDEVTVVDGHHCGWWGRWHHYRR